RAARVCSHSSMARNVSSRCRTGDSESGGKRAGGGSDNSDAPSGTLSGPARPYCSRRWSNRSNPAGGGPSRAEARSPPRPRKGRVQPGVLVVRRAAPFDNRCVPLSLDHLPQDLLLQRIDQARLAQARLADEEHDLTHPLAGLLPAVLEKADLVVAAGERRQP